jgi:hypothetical protein
VLDLRLPLRPLADRKALEFVQAHTFHPADFTIRSDGYVGLIRRCEACDNGQAAFLRREREPNLDEEAVCRD